MLCVVVCCCAWLRVVLCWFELMCMRSVHRFDCSVFVGDIRNCVVEVLGFPCAYMRFVARVSMFTSTSGTMYLGVGRWCKKMMRRTNRAFPRGMFTVSLARSISLLAGRGCRTP